MGDELSRPLKLLLVTGSRADYGHVRALAAALSGDRAFDFAFLVTGSHLASRFGKSVSEIEQDGFPIVARVELPLADDSPLGIATAMGVAIPEITAALKSTSPDAVVVYGDRWEMLAAALAATFSTVPLVHIGGGDVTEGAYDEGFRHAITKMSHLHFVSHETAQQRVRQLGEDPSRIFNTGSLAIDAIRGCTLAAREDWERETGFRLRARNILMTYHPTTLERDAASEVKEIVGALEALPTDIGILCTRPSMDKGSLEIVSAMESFAAQREGARVVASLGHRLYLSAIALFDVVVGNSSSGLYEVPSFGKPTVNIGDRQRGRLRANSVIDVAVRRDSILEAIQRAIEMDCRRVENPYGDGRAAERMAKILKGDPRWRLDVKKEFFRLP